MVVAQLLGLLSDFDPNLEIRFGVDQRRLLGVPNRSGVVHLTTDESNRTVLVIYAEEKAVSNDN